MENFEKCAKRKRKKHFISLHCPMLSVVVSPPLFLKLSLYVILDIPEVPAFKKRAQVCLKGRCKKKVKKTNNSAFSATHTYIKLTLVSFFYFFFMHLQGCLFVQKT